MIDAKRLALMTGGVEELEQWLLDMLRAGAAGLAEAPPDYWEDLAARMVDAKLGGVARRIRAWPAMLTGEEGPRRLVGEIADLYLYAQAFRRLDELTPDRRVDLLATGGVNQKKESVRKQADTRKDHWLAAGQIQGQEDNLKYRRTWFIGESTGLMALLLDYAWGRNDFAENWVTGSVFSGELVFYPSNYPQRALVKSLEWSQRPYDMPDAPDRAEAMLSRYARALALNPWLYTFPCLLRRGRVLLTGREWVLIDKERRKLPLEKEPAGGWQLAALSAAHPIDIFGEWDGNRFRPLTVISNQRLIPLTK